MDGSLIDYMEDSLLEYVMAHFKEPELQDKKIEFLKQKIAEKMEEIKEREDL